jgi:hypothetical protein
MGVTNFDTVAADALRLAGAALGATAAELNKLDGIAAPAGLVVAEEVAFTEAGAGTYTGSVTVPAGATILDIKVGSTVLWAAATSAAMDVGDATDPNGWFAAINLKATDLLVGEEINFVQTGGKEGAYLSTTTGLRSAAYSASARVVSGIIVSEGAGTAGRTRMTVIYALPASVTAATKA